MAKITIDRERCKGCMLCIHFCSLGLIILEKGLNSLGVEPAKFQGRGSSGDSNQCLGCMRCALICPDSCIEVYK